MVLRAFGGRKDGKPIYWVIDEMIVEGTERHLSVVAFDKGYKPETLVWIPDDRRVSRLSAQPEGNLF